MRADSRQKPRRARVNPLADLKLRIEVSEDDILADLHYPAPNHHVRRSR